MLYRDLTVTDRCVGLAWLVMRCWLSAQVVVRFLHPVSDSSTGTLTVSPSYAIDSLYVASAVWCKV